MKNKIILFSSILLVLIVLIVVFKYIINKNEVPSFEGNFNTEAVIKYSNEDNFTRQKLDSLSFIDKITSQKIQELFDLLIVSSNNEDEKLNKILNNQLKNYFLKEDTLTLFHIKNEIDSLNIGFAKLKSISILKKDSMEADSIGTVNFVMNLYKKDKKYYKTIEKSARYILKKNPEILKNEFKYYFSNFGKKDTIREGVTK